MDATEARKQAAAAWFRELRDRICRAFERIEQDWQGDEAAGAPGRFERKDWQRGAGDAAHEGGGGEISLMRGRVFEKVGVNISTVHGHFSADFGRQMPGAGDDGAFWASGISVVAHLRSPHVPAVHMNTRHIVTGKSWFGGGADLTPMFPGSDAAKADKATFHAALRAACDAHGPDCYEKFAAWCDEYFYLKHRGEPRGVGGIFYDYLEQDWDKDFAFTRSVGLTFLDVYDGIVRARMGQGWTAEDRERQLIRRGRYVEFNLLYDRGTMFGLKTGGNPEAILMSLPPEVKWP